MSGGRVVFVGCGPGAPDLLTLRAARAIAAADIVIWGRSLLPEEAVREHARAGADVIAWPPATMREVLAAYDRARGEGLMVVRLKGGDPATFGEMAEELAAVRERGLDLEIVPGVSAVGAAAAVAGVELGEVVLARGDRSMPAAVALFMPGRDPQRSLLARGLPRGAGCVVVQHASRPTQLVTRCALHELDEHLAEVGVDGATIVLAGVEPHEVPG